MGSHTQVVSSSHAKGLQVGVALEEHLQEAVWQQHLPQQYGNLTLQQTVTDLSMQPPSLSSWISLKALKSLLPLWSSCSPAGGHISVSEERMSACCATQRGVSTCTTYHAMSNMAAAPSALHHESAIESCLCRDTSQSRNMGHGQSTEQHGYS